MQFTLGVSVIKVLGKVFGLKEDENERRLEKIP
jgi:hypothetical protein